MPEDDNRTSSLAPAGHQTSPLPEGLDLERFWDSSANAARPSIETIRKRLSYFPSPPLRIQRVGQLDADLLDQELLELLLAPLKESLNLIRPALTTRILPELLLAMRLALFKLSIFDNQASYGSMLQNLKYRNEWAHSGGLQSTAKDARLSPLQLTLYPMITAIIPYVYTRAEIKMAQSSYSEMSTYSNLWNLLDRVRRWWALAAFLNFALFLGNGKYRTLADRLLGMRLVYAQRTAHRNVSFEYLNRQLVWHAFTEFLVFLLPLLRPRRILKRLLRTTAYTSAVSAAGKVIPNVVKKRISRLTGASSKAKVPEKDEEVEDSKYAQLPESTCALCWQRKEVRNNQPASIPRIGLPSSDPLDPSSGALTPGDTNSRYSSAFQDDEDVTVTIPHAAIPCQCVYCYHCLASVLLSEEVAEDIADEGGWQCLRCRVKVNGMERI